MYWRPLVTERALTRRSRLWTLTTLAHTIPFLATAVLLVALQPLTAPAAAIAVAFAWIIPELYAARGANVLAPRRAAQAPAERVAAGLLGDLLDHAPRELHRATGLVLERGKLGTWVVGEAGAVLVAPGGRRVHCYCIKAIDPALPAGDRIAHLLLALRADEAGFATIANLAFSGARWRLRRRLPKPAREALDAAGAAVPAAHHA